MLDQLMPLHWGLVDRTLNIFNVDPESRLIPPVKGSSLEMKIEAMGQVKRLSGRGSNKRVSGSGTAKNVRGSGRTC